LGKQKGSGSILGLFCFSYLALPTINKSTLDEGAEQVAGKDQEMKVLNEMNELQDFENDNGS
jgi:hypothetical protein